MSDIISELTKGISGQLLSGIAKSVGESESGVSKALGGIFPVLLGGVMKKATGANSSDMLGQLMGLLKGAPSLDSLTSKPESLLGVLEGAGDLTATAGKFVNMFLGDKVNGAVSLISKVAGIKDSSASSLMHLAAPMVMGQLGKKITDDHLSADGLLSYLGSQKNSILAAAPAGLGSVLGIAGGLDKLGSGLDDLGELGKTGVAKAIDEVTKKSSLLKPALIIGALVLGALFAWKSCAPQSSVNEASRTVTQTVTTVTERAPSVIATGAHEIGEVVADGALAVTETAENLWSNLGEFFNVNLPNGVSLHVPEFGVENKLLSFINNAGAGVDKTSWFSFDRLLFETNSAVLKPNSNEQLKNIAEVLKAYPNVNIKLGGYTDNTGAEELNLNLSQSRAESVKEQLVALGVSPDRVEAKGYGQEHPVASNDTAEGRAQNRRIDLLVTQK